MDPPRDPPRERKEKEVPFDVGGVQSNCPLCIAAGSFPITQVCVADRAIAVVCGALGLQPHCVGVATDSLDIPAQ